MIWLKLGVAKQKFADTSYYMKALGLKTRYIYFFPLLFIMLQKGLPI